MALLTGVGADAAVSLYGLCLEGEYYVTLLPYSISSGALESSDVLLSYSMIALLLAQHGPDLVLLQSMGLILSYHTL